MYDWKIFTRIWYLKCLKIVVFMNTLDQTTMQPHEVYKYIRTGNPGTEIKK